MSKSLKKIVEESRDKNVSEVDMSDRGISNMLDVPGLFVSANISELKNLEVLNLFNNQIEELPTQISGLQKLKHLNLGYVSFCLLAEYILFYKNYSSQSAKLTKLHILSLRDNDLISLPKEIGELIQLKELHIQGNRLTVLPPELGNLDLTGPKQVFKAENNPWVTPIADQFQLGVSHVFEYVRSETYKYLYGRHMQANPEPPKKNNDKSKKISRKPLAAKNK
uniref:Ras suppressor protein 1 n=1 Tax=Cynoglossus semilaevis TaxID=244447 RepID=A0A3P8VN62_CYNSE